MKLNEDSMKAFRYLSTLFILIAVTLSGCAGAGQTSTPTPLAPADYLENALQWLQTNAVMGKNIDWNAVRAQVKALNLDLQTTASTYPAICLALRSLKDGNAWLQVSQPPAGFSGYGTLYPENRVIFVVDSGSPAEQAGVHVGDVIESLNGAPPKPYDNLKGTVCDAQSDTFSPQDQLSLRRAGQDALIQVTVKKIPAPLGMDPTTPLAGRRLEFGSNGMGYLELPFETGDLPSYVGAVQQLIKKLDQSPTCGWILDLRRIPGGDIWSYLAAIGPILGEGDLGGFVYTDGRKEAWSYRQGQVYWAGNRRDESYIDGSVYHLKQAMPPVALLTSPATTAAGELTIVAFQGRPGVRTFGEATFGLPTLIAHTDLSDGARIFVSGAFSFDRNGKTYEGAITPDAGVKTDWSQFGTAQDPVIQAAQSWLQTQPACKP
jgi:carboxyl-terminal processing protease